ncbi:ribonuclease E inhibitor RraB [Metabacillus sp. 84]|uniref:ribonuclease E inhibitor RraB n=1 Tax=Metabacillus sp. 84 TaxID=3404705 RepID=UPI003CECBD13
MKFPKDEDGKILKMLYKEGVDFSKPQNVDFFIAVPDQVSGQAVAGALKEEGINSELEMDRELEEWTVACFIQLMLTYENITGIQERLQELCEPYGGEVDGWGVMMED